MPSPRGGIATFGAVLGVALAAAALADVAAAHRVQLPSRVTASFVAEESVFAGRVSSPQGRCERGRTVIVWRSVDGPDDRVGSASTNRSGRWRLPTDPWAASYYARIAKKNVATGSHRHVCAASSSALVAVAPVCGNLYVEAGEVCDDGNTVAGDGCDACQIESAAVCGNGIVDVHAGEVCDDGNTVAGDGCDACQIESPAVCGDGITDVGAGEACDDGNTVAGDGCDGACQPEAVSGSRAEHESAARTAAWCPWARPAWMARPTA